MAYETNAIIKRGKAYLLLKNYKDNPSLYDDEEITLHAVEFNAVNFRYASERLKGNKEISLIAVKGLGLNLQYVSKELKDDRELVLTAVKNNGMSIAYASDNLKADEEIVSTAIKTFGNALECVDYAMRDNYKIVKEAIDKNPEQIKFASERLKNDVEIVKYAYQKDRTVLKFIGDSAFSDEEFVLEILKVVNGFVGVNILSNDTPLGLFKAINGLGIKINLQSQRLDLLTLNKDKLYYVLQSGIGDFPKKRELFRKYVMLDDSRIISLMTGQEIVTRKYAKEVLQIAMKERKIKVLAILLNYTQGVTDDKKPILTEREKLLRGLNKGTTLSILTLRRNLDKYITDREVIITASKVDGAILPFIVDKYGSDREIVLNCIKSYIVNNHDKPFLSIIDENLLQDEEICELAVKKDIRNKEYLG